MSAKNKTRDCPLDLVVLEFELLVGKGDRVISLMQEVCCTPLVILITKRAQPKWLARQMGHPIEDGIRKPIEFDELAARIQYLVARRQFDYRVMEELS